MSNQFAGDLKFIGLSEDSEHLIVTSPSGEQYRLRVTPMVRAAVRLDRSAMEAAKADQETTLPPREIQMRIRGGMSAKEISQQSGVPLELVKRYEGPVLAEREFIAQSAQKVALAPEPGSPTLGQVVLDRLATRGVNILDLIWDAYKSPGHGWIVSVTFDMDNDIRSARWSYKQSVKQVTALDDDSRWLSETRLADEPIPRRHLSAVQNGVFNYETEVVQEPITSESPVVPTSFNETEELLDRLSSVRGTRTPLTGTSPTVVSGPTGSVHHLNAKTPTDSDVVFDSDDSLDDSEQTVRRFDREHLTGAIPAISAPSNELAQSSMSAPSQGAQAEQSGEHQEQGSPWAPGNQVPGNQAPGNQAPSNHAPLTSAISALTMAELGADPLTALKGSPRSAVSPQSATQAKTDADDEPATNTQGIKKSKKGRSPMPTWDEIMFGTKPE